jgi:hypothetical protein
MNNEDSLLEMNSSSKCNALSFFVVVVEFYNGVRFSFKISRMKLIFSIFKEFL